MYALQLLSSANRCRSSSSSSILSRYCKQKEVGGVMFLSSPSKGKRPTKKKRWSRASAQFFKEQELTAQQQEQQQQLQKQQLQQQQLQQLKQEQQSSSSSSSSSQVTSQQPQPRSSKIRGLIRSTLVPADAEMDDAAAKALPYVMSVTAAFFMTAGLALLWYQRLGSDAHGDLSEQEKERIKLAKWKPPPKSSSSPPPNSSSSPPPNSSSSPPKTECEGRTSSHNYYQYYHDRQRQWHNNSHLQLHLQQRSYSSSSSSSSGSRVYCEPAAARRPITTSSTTTTTTTKLGEEHSNDTTRSDDDNNDWWWNNKKIWGDLWDRIIIDPNNYYSNDSNLLFQKGSEFYEMYQMLMSNKKAIETVVDNFLLGGVSGSHGHESFRWPNLDPPALFYYAEYEYERKNPMWKRRVHRFCPSIIDENNNKNSNSNTLGLEDLYRAMKLAHLCYADSVEVIQSGLENKNNNKLHIKGDSDDDEYELIYTNLKASPGQPAHFIAVKKHQSVWSPDLEVLIAVRGTKSFADAITNILCDTQKYTPGTWSATAAAASSLKMNKNEDKRTRKTGAAKTTITGTAHSHILKSGQYLVQEHTARLEDLRKQARKQKIKLTLVGHSLGAGAASIAGMEWSHDPNNTTIDVVQVIGFGCPPILSKELAAVSASAATPITTVVNDWDIVPRLSAVSLANWLLEVQNFDWLPYAQRDIRVTLEELQRRNNSSRSSINNNNKDDSNSSSSWWKAVDVLRNQAEEIMSSYYTHSRGRRLVSGTEKEDWLDADSSSSRRQTKQNDDDDHHRHSMVEPELYPPGRCIHLYHDGSVMQAVYVPNHFFRHIDFNHRLVSDHLLHSGYEKSILETVRQCKGDYNFRFDDSLGN